MPKDTAIFHGLGGSLGFSTQVSVLKIGFSTHGHCPQIKALHDHIDPDDLEDEHVQASANKLIIVTAICVCLKCRKFQLFILIKLQLELPGLLFVTIGSSS